jgi:hypothetical protein
MIGEIDLDGVLVSSVLVGALIALALTFLVHRFLAWAGMFRFVWHPALFDVALFVTVWAGVIHLPSPPFLPL